MTYIRSTFYINEEPLRSGKYKSVRLFTVKYTSAYY